METVFEKRYKLNEASIDTASEDIFGVLSKYPKIAKKNILRIRLSAEEILLSWKNQAERLEFQLTVEKKGKKLDISISLHGINFECDPLDTDELSGIGIVNNLMATFGNDWAFQFDRGLNTVYISIATEEHNQVKNTIISVGAALVTIFILFLLPADIRDFINKYFFTYLFDIATNFLTAIVSPMVFLAVIGAVLSLGSPRYLNSFGKYVCRRYIKSTAGVLILSAAVGIGVFGINFALNGIDEALPILKFLGQIIPKDVVTPFQECNMLQIVFMAFVVGIALLLLQRQINVLGKCIEDANILICKILSAFDRIIPLFINFSIVTLGLSIDVKTALTFLKMAGCFIALVVVVLICYLIASQIRLKISPKTLWRNCKTIIICGFLSAVASTAFEDSYRICESTFGVEKKLTRFALPMGTIIYKPLVAAEFVLFVVAATNISGQSLDISNYLILIILAFVLSVAYPPVSGGEITCYTILLVQMGLPSSYLAFACAISSLFDFLEVPADLFLTIIQLLLFADKSDKLDKVKFDKVRAS